MLIKRLLKVYYFIQVLILILIDQFSDIYEEIRFPFKYIDSETVSEVHIIVTKMMPKSF